MGVVPLIPPKLSPKRILKTEWRPLRGIRYRRPAQPPEWRPHRRVRRSRQVRRLARLVRMAACSGAPNNARDDHLGAPLTADDIRGLLEPDW